MGLTMIQYFCKIYHLLTVKYLHRWRRYQGWLEVFAESRLTGPEWRQQAWRQSAWYEPRTGRSVDYLVEYGYSKISKT